MEEIEDQAALFAQFKLPRTWYNQPTSMAPNMAFMMHGDGLRHADGNRVLCKPEFMPPKILT